MERCSVLLMTRDMRAKTTMRYYSMPVRMAIIKNSTGASLAQSVVGNPPADAEDTCSTPDLGRSHEPHGMKSPCTTTIEPVLQSPGSAPAGPRVQHPPKYVCPGACALQQEGPPQWEACAPNQRVGPVCHNWRKAPVQQQRPTTATNNK